MCVNNPQLEAGYIKYLTDFADAQASVMQRDEPWGILVVQQAAGEEATRR